VFNQILLLYGTFNLGEGSVRRQNKSKSLKTLGKWIRSIRLKKELTQEDLDGCGINYKHYQDVERGMINPTYLTLAKIAEAFECDVKDLIPPQTS
jgi:DNA-binding XRE family transcriptional regulator